MGWGILSPKYLIDTVILIEHLNGLKKATDWLAALKDGEAVISVITYAEVLAGIKDGEEDEIYSFLDYFTCFPIQVSTAKLAASLRRKWRWKLPDAFQAALATENQIYLVTRNTKDFSSKKHTFVKIPY